jgi:hypothetical protein
MKSLSLLLTLLLLTSSQSSFAAETKTLRMRWTDVGALVQGKNVTVLTTGGAKYKGRVVAFDAGSLSFENPRTPRVNRSEIAEVRLIDYAGNGRRFGRLVGGALGLVLGLVGAVVIGMNETSSHKDRDKVLAGIMAVGGLPLGMLAGHFIGRRADREVTIIRVIPD